MNHGVGKNGENYADRAHEAHAAAALLASQKHGNADDHDEGVERPAERPGEGNEFPIISNSVDQSVRCQRVASIPIASAVLCVTIVTGMYVVGVVMWLLHLLFI